MTTPAERVDQRIRTSYAAEARRALLLSALLRFVIIAGWLALAFDPGAPDGTILRDIATSLVFVPVGVLQIVIVWRKIDWSPAKYLFILADVAILTIIVFPIWPGDPFLDYPALISRQETIGYSFVFLLLSLLYLSARAILWFALCSVLGWTILAVAIITAPGVVTVEDMPAGLDFHAQVEFALQPSFFDLRLWVEQLAILVFVAGSAAVVVGRMRKVAMRSARLERQRGNMARYFSPTVLDAVTQRDTVLDSGRERSAAILFADLRDYSRLTEELSPGEVLALLRDFHGAMEEQVFAFGGTLEKYIGDALMVTFGTPVPGTHDASHALCCAWAMLSALADVNQRRRDRGQPPISMGVGLHYGPVVVGDIGTERNMAFVTVGAAVNLASRVQGLTREADADVAITTELEDRIRAETTEADLFMAGFTNPHAARIKGFANTITVRHAALRHPRDGQ